MRGLVRRLLVGVLVAFMSMAVLPFIDGGTASAANLATANVTTPYLASVAMTATPTGHGYWLVGLDGGVFSFGDARYLGSLPGLRVAVKNIVGIDATPDGQGYWLVGADGGVFAFGDAAFYGSVPGVLGRPAPNAITGLAETPDGHGYWLVGADGGVFSFGDAQFYGSLPGIGIQPTSVRFTQSDQFNAFVAYSGVVSIQPTPDGHGYWLVGPDGSVFTFGDAGFYGSLPGALGTRIVPSTPHAGTLGARAVVGTGHAAAVPIIGFAATADGHGYSMVADDGTVYSFGDARFFGSLASAGVQVPPVRVTGFTPPSTVQLALPLATVAGITRTPDGNGYWIVSLDGGVFSFGDAQFFGSIPGVPTTIHGVVGIR